MNWRCIFLLISLHLSFVALNANSEASFRIVEGSPIDISQANYVVLVHTPKGERMCGGSLISMQHVVTAAHCVYNLTANNIIIKAGITCLNEVNQYGIGQQVFFPQGIDLPIGELDIAVVKLCTAFIPGPSLGEIPLCKASPKAGDMIHIRGWGMTQENLNAPSNNLIAGSVKVLDNELCAKKYKDTHVFITETKMCAGIGGTGICKGDSGGPGVNDNGELCAVISQSLGCGRPEYPCVFVNVQHTSVKEFLTLAAAS